MILHIRLRGAELSGARLRRNAQIAIAALARVPFQFCVAARLYFLLAFISASAACTIRLAPGYDKALLDGLQSANQDAMHLFAEAAADPSAAACQAKRETEYTNLIGTLNALRVEALARPEPPPFSSQFLGIGQPNPNMTADGVTTEIPVRGSPTPDILTTLVKTFTAMRKADCQFGVADTLPGFMNSYELSMKQALTYEKALER